MSTLRPELTAPPERMRMLPVHRGYPVPWFVPWVLGPDSNLFPEFRAMDPEKWTRAVKEKLCWVCGHRLGANLAFVIGPMCGITQTTSEPPCHLDCALWSATNCPFLTRPTMERRDATGEYGCAIKPPAGYHIDRNPGVMLVWVTNSYKVFSDGMGGHLIRVGEPSSMSAWSQGRLATPAEVDESVSSGLPLLAGKALNVQDAQELEALTKTFRSRLGL